MHDSGDIYIADSYNHRIKKVDAGTGIITTIAGNGLAGYNFDNIQATNARLYRPRTVYVDDSGNLYIADTDNHRIRRVDAGTGIITTIAGNGIEGYSGDGGQATDAQLDSLKGVYMDASGNILIADTQNHRIRKVDTSGIITTIAGNGTAGYSGNGGQATEAQLAYPRGVYVPPPSKNYVIADADNNRIRKVDAAGTITTIAGIEGSGGYSGDGGPATSAQLDNPKGVCIWETEPPPSFPSSLEKVTEIY